MVRTFSSLFPIFSIYILFSFSVFLASISMCLSSTPTILSPLSLNSRNYLLLVNYSLLSLIFPTMAHPFFTFLFLYLLPIDEQFLPEAIDHLFELVHKIICKILLSFTNIQILSSLFLPLPNLHKAMDILAS
jgi:hypothetical protein